MERQLNDLTTKAVPITRTRDHQVTDSKHLERRGEKGELLNYLPHL